MFSIQTWHPDETAVTEEISALLGEVFTHRAWGVSWFHWKHAANPYGPSIVLYARDQETQRIVAARAFWRHRLRVDGREVLAFQPCDTATHPDFQRRGLFTQLTTAALQESARQQAACVFNFPNHSSKPGYVKLGWHDHGGMHALVRICHYPRVFFALLKTRGRIGVSTPLEEALPSVHRLSAQQFQACRSVSEISHDQSLIIPVKTEAYYRWRLLDHPFLVYYGVPCGDGLAVIRFSRRGTLREAILVDLLAPLSISTPRFDVRALCRQLARHCACDIVSTIVTANHPLVRVLGAAHFRTIRTQANFVSYPMDHQGAAGLSTQWAMTPIDIDTF